MVKTTFYKALCAGLCLGRDQLLGNQLGDSRKLLIRGQTITLHGTLFRTLVFAQIKQMKYCVLISELLRCC